MAIIKRKGSYQVKLRGTDGKWVTRTFGTKSEATAFEIEFRRQKLEGQSVTNASHSITMDEYCEKWFRLTEHQGTRSWRKQQQSIYSRHIRPFVGTLKLRAVAPQAVGEILNSLAERGYAPATRLHVYVVLKKMFADAIELFQILSTNPVHKRMRPRLSQKEARYLNLDQLKALLTYSRERPLGLAVWLSAYLGLRVGEVQALRWEDVDLQSGVVHIRRTYSKHESVFRDYPKGRKQHSHRVPQELSDFLEEMKPLASGELVVQPPGWKMLDYWMYRKVLQQYCKEACVPVIATHGLRHSTSELYQTYGASRDDLRQLFAHSSASTTERYIHRKGDSLEKVAKVIQLFPQGIALGASHLRNDSGGACSQNVPISNSILEGGEASI